MLAFRFLLFTWACGFVLAGCTETTTDKLGLPPLTTVPSVDLERYLGTWYEIASYPKRYQAGCTGTRATYSMRDDGDIKVINRCLKGSLDGPEDVAEGRARLPAPNDTTKLEVSFFWPFWGDYWIIDLDPNYRWAVVGAPSRDSLWILSRSPTMDAETYAAILDRIAAQGYPLDRLEKTQQSPSP